MIKKRTLITKNNLTFLCLTVAVTLVNETINELDKLGILETDCLQDIVNKVGYLLRKRVAV